MVAPAWCLQCCDVWPARGQSLRTVCFAWYFTYVEPPFLWTFLLDTHQTSINSNEYAHAIWL